MADVYGFNEAKSKIAVVDKATQDAKDSSQDSNIANKALSNVGLTLNDKNLMFSVEQADGTSKNASVELALGGGIETEYYNPSTTALDEANFNRTVTFSQSITVPTTSSSSKTWYIEKASQNEDSDALYYDSDDSVLKRCIEQSQSVSSSGTFATTKYNGSISSTYETVLTDAFSWLLSVTLNQSVADVWFKVGSAIVNVNADNDVTSDGYFAFQVYSASTSVTFSGTMDISWVNNSSTGFKYPIKTVEATSIPSTYTKIADL